MRKEYTIFIEQYFPIVKKEHFTDVTARACYDGSQGAVIQDICNVDIIVDKDFYGRVKYEVIGAYYNTIDVRLTIPIMVTTDFNKAYDLKLLIDDKLKGDYAIPKDDWRRRHVTGRLRSKHGEENHDL